MVDRDSICALARMSVGDGPCEEMLESALGTPFQSSMRKLEWCGLWLLWLYHQSGVANGIHWRMGHSLPAAMTLAQPTWSLKPGDFGIFRRFQHHVLVAGVDDQVVSTIAGNTGPRPGIVGAGTCRIHTPDVTWFSIEPYLSPKPVERTYLESE